MLRTWPQVPENGAGTSKYPRDNRDNRDNPSDKTSLNKDFEIEFFNKVQKSEPLFKVEIYFLSEIERTRMGTSSCSRKVLAGKDNQKLVQ